MTPLLFVVLVFLTLFSLVIGTFLLKRASQSDQKSLESFSLKRNGISCLFFSLFLIIIMVCFMP